MNIYISRPILASSLSLLVLLICSYHFLSRVGLNLSILVGLAALTVCLSLIKEAKIFLLHTLEDPRKKFLILCILFFSFAGIIFHFENTTEIGFFLSLFFSIYLIFKQQDTNLNNFIVNLMICSGVLMSIGVLMGLFELVFLSSKLFYHNYDGYPYIEQKFIFSGFGFNHNFSAYIIIVAQSFLFLSTSTVMKNLRMYLTVLFLCETIIKVLSFLFI